MGRTYQCMECSKWWGSTAAEIVDYARCWCGGELAPVPLEMDDPARRHLDDPIEDDEILDFEALIKTRESEMENFNINVAKKIYRGMRQ